jgi:hypothetical protein
MTLPLTPYRSASSSVAGSFPSSPELAPPDPVLEAVGELKVGPFVDGERRPVVIAGVVGHHRR